MFSLTRVFTFSSIDRFDVVCVEKQTHEAEISHQAESPRGYPGELELLRQELGRPIATWWTECWTNTKDVLNVFWLSAGIQIRSVQSKISDCFQTKPEMEIQTVDSKDFGLEERKYKLYGRWGLSVGWQDVEGPCWNVSGGGCVAASFSASQQPCEAGCPRFLPFTIRSFDRRSRRSEDH